MRLSQKRGLKLVMLGGILLLSTQLWAALPRPTAKITSFTLEKISLKDVTFGFELEVKNPYPLGLSFSGMTLNFLVEGSKVFATKSQGGFKVPGNQTKSNKFTVVLTYASMIQLVKDYAAKEWLDTVVQGQLTTPLPSMPGLPKDISFDYELKQKIPAVKPTVEIRGFTVKGPSAKDVEKALTKSASKVKPKDALGFLNDLAAGKKHAKPPMKASDIDVPFTVSFTLAIKNDAKAALGFNSLGYELWLDGQSLVKGESGKVKKEGNTTLITVDNTFSSKQLSEGLQALFAAKKGRFRITGSALVSVPAEVRKTPLPLAFDEEGGFSF